MAYEHKIPTSGSPMYCVTTDTQPWQALLLSMGGCLSTALELVVEAPFGHGDMLYDLESVQISVQDFKE